MNLTAGATPKLILASSPYPDLNDPNAFNNHAPYRFFRPQSWSPDGSRLLISYSDYPDSGGYALLDVLTNHLIAITPADENWTTILGEAVWAPDGQTLYIASDLTAYSHPGLSHVDVATRVASPIISAAAAAQPEANLPFLFVRAPYVDATGIRALVSANTESVDRSRDAQPYTLSRIDATNGALTPLSNESFTMTDNIWYEPWAPDGAGVALLAAFPGGEEQSLWIPGDGSPSVALLITGSNVRWPP